MKMMNKWVALGMALWLALGCGALATAEEAFPTTWQAAVKTYHLPEIPYIEAPVTGDLQSGQIAVKGLAQQGFSTAQIIYHTDGSDQGSTFMRLIEPNATIIIEGAYNAQSDIWQFEDEDKLMGLMLNSLSIGEGKSPIVRFTKPLGETEDGWTREYRYEMDIWVNDGMSANGYTNRGVYVEYRPAKQEGEADEMRLMAVLNAHKEHTLTLYKKDGKAASQDYDATGIPQVSMPERVEDFSTVDGLFLSLSEADFLPKLVVPNKQPTLARSAEQWVVKKVPQSDDTEVNLLVYSNGRSRLTLPLTYDEKQQAYVCTPTQKATELAGMDNTEIELHLILPLPGYEGKTYTQEYDFTDKSWDVSAEIQHGYQYSISYHSDSSKVYVTCADGELYYRWKAQYDKQGALVEVKARPDVIK